MSGPLTGLKVVEFEGIGPAPYCGMLLSDLGADVVRVARPAANRGPFIPTDRGPTIGGDVIGRGRDRVMLDLKSGEGVAAALDLLAAADACIEGLRPGVMERLGLGPEAALARNPALVYVRITGWGQAGPFAKTAGHDLNYIALSGALAAMGEPGRPPVPPLNLVGDYGGGGLYAAFGLLAGVFRARLSGQGQVVDAAMIDGAASQMAMLYGMFAHGQWTATRGENLLDGGAPFYRCYACACGGHLSVAAIEPQFFAALMAGLGLEGEGWDQTDRTRWPEMAARLAEVIGTRTRDDWAAVFDGTDACVAPVLSMAEAPAHPHNAARATFAPGPDQPAPGPRFSATPGAIRAGEETDADAVLARWVASPGVSRLA